MRVTLPSAATSGRRWRLRLADHAPASAAVHQHRGWRIEAEVPHAALLANRRLRIQPLPIDPSLMHVGVHSEVADLEGSQVLKEVTALRGRHPQIAEARFDDHARSGNFVPLHRNAQPWIIRSPASDTDQQVRRIRLAQLGIEVRDIARHFNTARTLKAVKVDDHNVPQVFDPAIAQNLRALANEKTCVHVIDAKLFASARQNQRTDLQEPEIRLLAQSLRQADGKLNFNRSPKRDLPGPHQL